MTSRRIRTAAVLALAALGGLAAARGAATAGRPYGQQSTAGAGRRAGPPPASPRERAEALSRRAADRMAELRREADLLASQEQSLLTDLRRLEVQRELANEQARQAEQKVADVTAQIQATTARITALEQQAARLQPAIDARLVALYELGRGGYARLLLSASALRDLGRAYRMVSAMSALDRQQITQAQQTLADLREARTALDEKQTQLQTLQASAERARQAAARAAAARTALVNRIDHERDLNAELTGELQVAQQKLQATLAALASGAANTPVPILPLAPFQGALDWPVNGRVLAPFHSAPGSAGFARDGIDIGAAEGTPVHAVHGGTVAFAGPFAGFGRLVILDHGNRDYSLYGDLGALADGIVAGARVDAAQPVGTVGLSAAGPAALYFELQIDGRAVDPLQWLKARHGMDGQHP